VGNLTWPDVVIIGALGMLGFTLLSYWFSGIMNRRNWSWQVKPKPKKPSDANIQAGSQKPGLE
jgi:hypothetical protein